MSASEPAYVEPILGVVFDLDGTLVESHHDFPRMRREVIRIAERHGIMPGHLSITDPIPKILEAAVAELEQSNRSEGEVFRFETEVAQSIDTIELEALPKTRARPGAEPLLRELTNRGYRLGLLTRSSEGFARAALQKTGLLPFFPSVRTRSASGPAKPSPEALRMLLEGMGVPPERAVFVGDHFLDAECAVRARVRFYGVAPETGDPPGSDSELLKAAGASAVAENLLELAQFFGVRVASPTPPA